MRPTKLCTILLFTVMTATAKAEDFSGFGLGLDLHLKSTGGDGVDRWVGPEETFNQSFSLGGEQDVVGGLNLNFGLAVTPKVMVHIGGSFDFNSTQIYEAATSSFAPTGETIGASTIDISEDGHYSVYLAPGYLLSPATLVYAKVAYHRMNAEWSSIGVGMPDEAENISESFDGYGVGAGIKTTIARNFYAFAEVQQVYYDKGLLRTQIIDAEQYTLEVDLSSTLATVGIGYRF